MAALALMPVSRSIANGFVARHHRHSKPVQGFKFAVGVSDGAGALVGVAIAGRPVARELDDNLTIEILRVCTNGARNACTKLYGACCRAAEGMGYTRAITYTLAAETGASLRAAGFLPASQVRDRQWGCVSRPRVERDLIGDKVRWERWL